MVGEPPFYVELDGSWHEVAYDKTVCGMSIPFGMPLQYDVPDKVHCGKDDEAVMETVEASSAEVTPPEPEPAKSKAKAKK